ncbi:MAG: hypothetical protein ACRECJ_06555 [Limisphaerales bacterium]
MFSKIQKRKPFFTAVAALFAGFFLLRMAGCTLIGFGVGSIVDSTKPDRRPLPGWKMEALKPGTKIDLFLRDGTVLSGKYAGLYQRPEEEYAGLYSAVRREKEAEVLLPPLGESLTVGLMSGRDTAGVFLGFDFHTLLLRKGVDTSRIELPMAAKLNLAEAEPVKKLSSDGAIPFRSMIELKTRIKIPPHSAKRGNDSLHRVAAEQVVQIQIPTIKKGKSTGALIGAIVDVAVLITVAIIAATEEDPPPPPPSDGGGGYYCGCPFIYSFDGEKFAVEGEAFSGSIFKAAQRPDWMLLNHLKVEKDICRLKISNELQETDFIDEAKLLLASHPAGTTVVPSLDGRLHTLKELHAPLRAVDSRGANVLELVKTEDDRAWISNPFGRNPANPGDLRDGLILEFQRPLKSDFVKLVFNVQNTLWGAYLQAHFVGLQGRAVESWYERLNNSAEARQQLQQAMVREGMLLVQLWDGESWRPAGLVWEVGINAFRNQVVRVDLSGLSGETLRIKLESTPGIWMVDGAWADFTPDAPVEVEELSPVSAVDKTGIDVTEKINETDNRHYRMDTGDWAELVFSLPKRKAGRGYSFVFKSNGYYLINVPPDGEPQSALANRLIVEPGAFGQYALSLLNQYATYSQEERGANK